MNAMNALIGLVAAVYVRVSSLAQVDGTSLETQEVACVEMAQSMGYVVFPEYIFRETVSGAYLERPELSRLRRVTASGNVSALFVYTSDRLSRDPLDLLNILAEMGKQDVLVHFVEGKHDDSPEGRVITFFSGYASQRERMMFRERSIRGKNKTAQEGRMPARGGDALFGYYLNPETGKRVVNEEEAAVVRLAFQLRLSMNTFSLCRRFNEEGILTKTGKKWTGNTMGNLLTNLAYLGESFYGKTRSVRYADGSRKIFYKDPSTWIPLKEYTPAIVSRELFEAVQVKLRESSTRGRPDRSEPQYLLTSFVRCGSCGGNVCGVGGKGEARYYRCTDSVAKEHKPESTEGIGAGVDTRADG